ncbi:MAG TPA: type VI secretion system-associated protein TagF [Acetobacteraceae bacterium]|nr:type VI secretion system-associated protein TagF [Acetobacteraceae bacterium]
MQDRRIAVMGLYGKLPARGDFVRLGLPGDFVTAWDDWLAHVIAASRDRVGAEWLPAFLEAPVWRFALAPGLAGAQAATGVWMPSVDRVGRYFPLTLAVTLPAVAPDWLDACEAAGRAALEADAAPEDVLRRLPPPAPGGEAAATGSLWWSAGGPRVAPMRLCLPGLPDPLQFARMLGAESAMTTGTEA